MISAPTYGNLLFAALLTACAAREEVSLPIAVTPIPLQVTETPGLFVFSEQTDIWIEAPAEDKERLVAFLASPALRHQSSGGRKNTLLLQTVDSLPGITSAEGYRLTVSPDSIVVQAATGSGLFYGVQTLVQMQQQDEGKGIAAGSVTDEPRFAYRGVMLDVSRHFFGKEFVKKQIDAMARYKLNRLHLHLTDAAGWRIEIKKYPQLTQLGAWRDTPDWKTWWNGDRKYKEEGAPEAYGGYFTQDDIRELVEYARERYITIVPEIEMPAHSEEVLTAYPELSCTHEPYRQADFCVGSEKTFAFLEDVLTEVMELFPSEYIHVGGDEAGKASWSSCPLCQERMQTEGLSSIDHLQGYLIRRIGKFLQDHGRKLLGWDEILSSGLPEEAAVMSWRGTEGGLKAVAKGHPTIMSPGEYCYIDSYQDAPSSQPEAIGGYLPLSKVYSYDPVPDTLNTEAARLIYGVQANLWTEYVSTPEHAEMMLYPRIIALAEVAWSAPERKDYADFRSRALNEVAALQAQGYHPFDLQHEIGNRLGTDTVATHLAVGCSVTYAAGGSFYPGYSAGGDSALVDGVRGGWSYSDHRWQGFIDRKGLDATIDLGKVTMVHSIAADFMQICGPGVYLPDQVTISASADGQRFKELARIEHTVEQNDSVSFKTYGWEGTAEARYICYRATIGGFGGFLFVDEIIVE